MRRWGVACGVTAFVVAALCAVRPVPAADDVGISADLPAEQLARELLVASRDPEAGDAYRDGVANVGVNASRTRPVLEVLARDTSAAAAMLRAELLQQAARGDDRPRSARRRSNVRAEKMPHEEIGRRAGELLDHEDPFARAMAEWAISIFIVQDNCRRGPRVWPKAESPDWYVRWEAIGAEELLDLDYARQAIDVDGHRFGEDLLASGRQAVERAHGSLGRPLRTAGPGEAGDLRARLADAEAALGRLERAVRGSAADLTEQRRLWIEVRRAVREAVLANPDVDFDGLVFGTRAPTSGNGNITAGHRLHIHNPGGDIYVKDGLAPESPVRSLLAPHMHDGHIRGMELGWDVDRVLFAYTRWPDFPDPPALPSHIYELTLEDGALRQITDHPYYSDFEPTYLPDGDIVFVSDRSDYQSQCAGSHRQNKLITNLWKAEEDGTGVRVINNNLHFNRHPRILHNGQVVYVHWEYQERHLWHPHTLWTSRPDGTQADAFYKQHVPSGPMSLREARQVPDSDRLVAIACGHHNYDHGAVMLVDPTKGINDPEGMLLLTPDCSGTEGGYGGRPPVPQGGVRDGGGYYKQPLPLSEESFLAAYSYHMPRSGGPTDFDLYYIDVWGNKELIHRDRMLDVIHPMPLKPRSRPVALPESVPADAPRFATVYVSNVYSDMAGVEPGEIEYIRISQPLPWPSIRREDGSFYSLMWHPTGPWPRDFGVWAWGARRVIGTVPVEEDGSAYFKVPADQHVYFQALDENKMEVRRMRSMVAFQAGEERGCLGCHESRVISPAPRYADMPAATRREPSMPEPAPFGYEMPGFERHIQPILDRNCVSCHGSTEPEAGLDFTSHRVDGYNQAYRTMFGLKPDEPTPVQTVGRWRDLYPDAPAPPEDYAGRAGRTRMNKMMNGEHPGQLISISNYFSGPEVTEPKQFGTHRSKLILTLLSHKRHRKVRAGMSDDEWETLVTWIDIQAPYWDTYWDHETVSPSQRVRVDFPSPWEAIPYQGNWKLNPLGPVADRIADASATQ